MGLALGADKIRFKCRTRTCLHRLLACLPLLVTLGKAEGISTDPPILTAPVQPLAHPQHGEDATQRILLFTRCRFADCLGVSLHPPLGHWQTSLHLR